MTLTKEDLQAIADLIDKTFDEKLDQKFDLKFDQKFDEKFDQKFDEKFDQKLDQKLNEIFDRKLDEKFQPMNNRLAAIESELSALQCGQGELKEALTAIRYKVNDTYELALDAWGQSEENRHWLASSP